MGQIGGNLPDQREGNHVIAMGAIKNNKVIFVCTGNYYRSRLAEILFNDHALRAALAWDAESRGLFERGSLSGLSPDAAQFLLSKGFDSVEHFAKEPQRLKVDDLENSQLVIVLNKNEHEPIMKMKFGRVPTMLEKSGRLRYWNVYDVPSRRSPIQRIFKPHVGGEQPPESSGEHIDFAVQTLVQELKNSGLETDDSRHDIGSPIPSGPRFR